MAYLIIKTYLFDEERVYPAFLYALLFIFFSLLAITIFIFLVVSLTKIKKKIKDVNYDLNPYILKILR